MMDTRDGDSRQGEVTAMKLRIRQLRTARRESQGELAEAINVSRQVISYWETGKRMPRADYLKRLADHFGVDVDVLFVRAEYKECGA